MRNDLTKEVTGTLAKFASDLHYEDIPADVREKAKIYILDSLGCCIGGYLTQPGKIVAELFTSMGGVSESRILATGKKIPCLHAVYVNSYLSNALDFDDTFSTFAHPGGMIIPPALAVAEKVGGITGRDYVAAVVAGYEVSLRVGMATAPSPERYKQAWGISTHQVFGSATVAAKLLSLDSDATAVSYGFAGNSAPVPHSRKLGAEVDERPFSWLKNNFGWASMGGVLAAFLTEKGFIGPCKILDGERGFWTMCGSDQCDFELMVNGLGETFLMSETSLKPYASCRWTHTTLDAIREILDKVPLNPEMVEKVHIRSFFEVSQKMNEKNPSNIVDAQFSVPFLVAVTIMGRSPHTGLHEQDLRDPKVLALAERVSLAPDLEADRIFLDDKLMPSTVTIRMKDGHQFKSRVDVPRGSPGKLQPLAEQLEKYKALVSEVLGKEKSMQSMERIMEIESLSDVGHVV
jgi:2-methylcitrate dehydratase PrpD